MTNPLFARGELPQTTISAGHFVLGTITGDEDFTIAGRVEGEISISKTLTLLASGIVKANVTVKSAVISGVLVGDITATDCVELTKDCRMVGDIRAPRVIIADGARFRGRVAMREVEARTRPAPRTETRGSLRSVPKPPPPPGRTSTGEVRKAASKPLPPPPPKISTAESSDGPKKKVVINVPQAVEGDKTQTVAMLMRAAALYRDAGSNVRALQMLGHAQKLQEEQDEESFMPEGGVSDSLQGEKE